jgi:hypothetical protein
VIDFELRTTHIIGLRSAESAVLPSFILRWGQRTLQRFADRSTFAQFHPHCCNIGRRPKQPIVVSDLLSQIAHRRKASRVALN